MGEQQKPGEVTDETGEVIGFWGVFWLVSGTIFSLSMVFCEGVILQTKGSLQHGVMFPF